MKAKTRKIHEAWKKYKKWVKTVRDDLRPGAEITSLSGFKEAYEDIEGRGSKLQIIKSQSLYETKLKTAKAELDIIKAIGRDKVSLKELRKMNTHVVIREYFDEEIKEYYKKLIEDGVSKADAKKNISSYYFGS